MPKQISVITDDDIKFRLSQLDGSLPLIARQVAIILQCSPSWLEEARKRTGPEGPPPFKKMGAGRKSGVRYLLQDIRDYLDSESKGGLKTSYAFQKAMKVQQRRSFSSFSQFITEGHADDAYPMTRWNGKLYDFFKSLEMSVDDSAECEWYTLEKYLTERLAQATHDRAEELHKGLAGQGSRTALSTKSKSPRPRL